MKRKLISVLLSVLFLTSCVGRLKHVSNVPQGVSEQAVKDWYSAVGALNFLSSQSKKVTQAIVQLNRSGVFPDGPEYIATLRALGKADQVGLEAVAFLQTAPQTWNQPVKAKIGIYARQIGDALSEATSNGLLGIKNEDSKVMFQQLINLAVNAVNMVISISQIISGRILDGGEIWLTQQYLTS